MNQLTNDLEVLAGLHERGDLTEEEFARAKAALLNGFNPETVPSTTDETSLVQIARQNEIAQLDREWLLEREKYVSTCKHGNRSEPDKTGSVFIGILVAFSGGIWGFSAASAGAPMVFSVVGIFFVIFGIICGVKGYEQADAYEAAQRRYYDRRNTLTQEGYNAPSPSRDI